MGLGQLDREQRVGVATKLNVSTVHKVSSCSVFIFHLQMNWSHNDMKRENDKNVIGSEVENICIFNKAPFSTLPIEHLHNSLPSFNKTD